MAKCLYCHARKGKRSCPALSGWICSACCGEHRGIRISCPDDCPYLSPHETYQQERLGGLFVQRRQGLQQSLQSAGGRKAIQLLRFCDAGVCEYVYEHPGAEDAEILAGLEYVRGKLSPITPARTFQPGAHWETFHQRVEKVCQEEKISQDAVLEWLDLILRFIRDFSGPTLGSRRALKGLIGAVERSDPGWADRFRQKSQAREKVQIPGTPERTEDAPKFPGTIYP